MDTTKVWAIVFLKKIKIIQLMKAKTIEAICTRKDTAQDTIEHQLANI